MTMDCLLLGLSSFARRRVIPALGGTRVHVASRSATPAELDAVPSLGRSFRDYGDALAHAPPAWVYVSLTNEAHAHWVEQALLSGRHVVVDKPAVTTLADAERLVELAERRGLVMAEAITYLHHPALARVLACFADAGDTPRQVTAHLMPRLPAGNFRFLRERGGGAFLDLGPYAASLGRAIWGVPPISLAVATHQRSGDEVEVSFSMLAGYGEGRNVTGHYSLVHEYRSWVHVAGAELAVDAPGLYSTAPGVATELSVRRRDVVTTETVPGAVAMERFLAVFHAAVASGDGRALAHALLEDARVIDRLRRTH
jgi:predicted dehydrogenase